MTWFFKYKCVLVILCILLASCSGTKHLPPEQKLYTGSEIELETTGGIKRSEKRSLTKSSQNLIRPEPNKKFLGFRPKLWMYMIAGENPESKFKKWLKRRGEAPVLMSHVKPWVTAEIIDAGLFNRGIFRSQTGYKTVEKKHTGKLIYTSHVHKPYAFNDLIYDVSYENINQIILSESKKSLIRQGDNYSLETLRNERSRLDDLLKNHGYFYFNPDYLLFKADTSMNEYEIRFTLNLKDKIPDKALTSYRINKVFIDQDYSLEQESADQTKDTIMIDGNHFLWKDSEMKIRPKVISRSVFFKKYEPYSRTNHSISLYRLMTMGNFKFVSIKFSDSDTAAAGFLDATILMTPVPKRTFRTEIEIVSKSNNYTGPRLNTGLINRNTFNGAELLNLTLAGSFEAQLSGKNNNLFSYSMSPMVELYFPHFLVPFKIKRTRSLYIPKTRFSLSYVFSKRVDYFDMQTLHFIYGFRWKEDIKKEHELNPVDISFTKITNKTDAFNTLLEANPFLKNSYEEEFIAGINYSYTFNEQVLPSKKMQYFLQLSSETAGNVFSLVKTIAGEEISPGNPSKVAGSVYSQYGRLSMDGRGFYNLKNESKLATRIYTGVAIPYVNSDLLPYTRQFFSGGPSSIRAFRINSLGPGTYNQNNDSIGFLQLGGDVKAELNAEYRFTIYRVLKGALFIDAGNVWLLKSNPSALGGAFSFTRVLSELALGTGFGLRVDISFFILRFDLAIPLRKPWLEEDERWVINQINFRSPSWRSENLILNIAIGYPF
jgi:outer membrane protein insertion porin family